MRIVLICNYLRRGWAAIYKKIVVHSLFNFDNSIYQHINNISIEISYNKFKSIFVQKINY